MAILKRVLSDDFMLTSGGKNRRDAERLRRETERDATEAKGSYDEDVARAQRITRKYRRSGETGTGIKKFMVPKRFRR